MITYADTAPERRLWSAVIGLAVTDLKSPHERRQQEAASFFASQAFDLVGNAAGLEPENLAQMRDLASTGQLRFHHERRRRCQIKHGQGAAGARERRHLGGKAKAPR